MRSHYPVFISTIFIRHVTSRATGRLRATERMQPTRQEEARAARSYIIIARARDACESSRRIPESRAFDEVEKRRGDGMKFICSVGARVPFASSPSRRWARDRSDGKSARGANRERRARARARAYRVMRVKTFRGKKERKKENGVCRGAL